MPIEKGRGESTMWLRTRQMAAMLRKNFLLKKADLRQTLAEVVLPALFMLLLVWIKSVTKVYDSPSVAYVCGQTLPWRYDESLPFNPASLLEDPLVKCLQKPPECTAEHYYRDEGGLFAKFGLQGLFPTVGYMNSGEGYPWYGLTVGDSSHIYADLRTLTGFPGYNPSMSIQDMAHRLVNVGQKAFIAVAPADGGSSGAENLDKEGGRVRLSTGSGGFQDTGSGGVGNAESFAAHAFAAWLVDELGGPGSSLAEAVQVFDSEQAVMDFIVSSDYEDVGVDDDKHRATSTREVEPTFTPSADERGGVLQDEFLRSGKRFRGGGGGGQEAGRSTETEAEELMGANVKPGDGKVAMAIIFNEAPKDGGPASWDYTLRLNFTYEVSRFQDQAACLYPGCKIDYNLPSTMVTTSSLERPPTSDHLFGYSYSGFLSVQKAVDEYILSSAAGQRVYLNVSMGFFPEKAYRTDQFQEVIASTLGVFYMLAFLYPVSRAIRALVSEKEGRMKEALRMMGLPDFVYHASWFVTFQAQWLVTNALILAVVWTTVFRYSDKGLVFLWLEALGLAITAFCFFVSTFFSKSKTAATLGSLFFFAAFFPYYYVGGQAQSSLTAKTWACLLAPTCLALSSDTFAAFEGGLVGVQVSNAGQSYETRLPYVTVVSMLLVDTALYFTLSWYLDKVIPSEFGTPLPWHFPVSEPFRAWQERRELKKQGEVTTARDVGTTPRAPSWFGTRGERSGKERDRGEYDEEGGTVGDDSLDMPLLGRSQDYSRPSRQFSSGLQEAYRYDEDGDAKVEAVDAQLSRQVVEGRTVSTRGLMKVYDNGKVAVKGLDLDLFEGHISVLLGHNGAGKSTAISMITGTLPPTRGEAFIRGKRLTRDLVGVRQSLGVCFQQNTLFDQLTVNQHLELFAIVKGVDSKDVAKEVARMVAEVGLAEKKHAPTSALSGGQKRKLSVAIAFVGGSEVVVLDEPTSGMDPFSRRSTWNVLQRQREGRVILLTTHFMDEADTLGDRIAIMGEGELRCLGSSLFLKGLYGVGYTLTVISQDDDARKPGPVPSGAEGSRGDPSVASGSRGEDSLHELIVEHVPEALVVSDVGKERNYRLPFSSAGQFVGMFRQIDARREELGIAGYGVSVTTLEEVFLRVGRGTDELLLPDDPDGMHEGAIPSARLPSIDLPSESPSPVTTSSGGAAGSSSSLNSLAQEQRPNGSQPGGWEESKQGADRGGDETRLDVEAMAVGDSKSAPARVVDRRADTGMFWIHFKALLQKRFIYGMRDRKSLFFQLIVPTLLFLLGLILLRLGHMYLNQPSLELSPTKQFNPDMPSGLRNPVPLDVPEEDGFARAVGNRFDGVSIPGKPILTPSREVEDKFGGCAQGAAPLLDMSNFLLEAPTDGEKGATRYGAVILDNSSQLSAPGIGEIHSEGGWNDAPTSSLVYGVLVNASAVHGAPIFMNLVHSAALQAVVAAAEGNRTKRAGAEGGVNGGDDASGSSVRDYDELPSITVRNNPLPRTRREQASRQAIEGFSVAIMVVTSVCFLPASYAIFVVKERAIKAKHQQMISGVGVAAYWASTYAFDIITYVIPCAVFLGLLYAFGVPNYTQNEGAVATALLFLLYGPAVAPFTYCISFIFKSASSAQNIVLLINFMTGLALMVTSFVLNLLESTKDVNAKLKWVYRLFPGFCLGDGLAQVVICDDGKTCMDLSALGEGMPETLTPLSWKITGADILCMFACSVGYLCLCLAIEYVKSFPKLLSMLSPGPQVHDFGSRRSEDDEDVATEARRVEHIYGKEDEAKAQEVILKGLRKVYKTRQGPKVAVEKLSFAVARGDCFGFLGINGAGKSTTLGILSGDVLPTAGEARIVGHDILTEQSKLRRYIGYCPQEDALLDLLTVEEHLLLFARIKGMEKDVLMELARDKMEEMDLTAFRSVKSCELSGGNKRKLSVAIAMIGEPRVVFLDEPSTGMDPIARRFMWDIISRMTTKGKQCSVILTTHSMEEAESLCNNIGIMVNGRLRCLGSTQHLKQRYGRGFEADIKLQPPSASDASAVLGELRAKVPESVTGQDLERARLAGPLEAWCRALSSGSSQRAKAMEEALTRGSGAFLVDVMASEGGSLPARLFVDWYLSEDVAAKLEAFLGNTFPGSELLERATPSSFRYKISRQDGMTLADIFGHFEEVKAQLGLASYAVGQTTLEQIFNEFAASRDNPEVELAALGQ